MQQVIFLNIVLEQENQTLRNNAQVYDEQNESLKMTIKVMEDEMKEWIEKDLSRRERDEKQYDLFSRKIARQNTTITELEQENEALKLTLRVILD